MTHTIPYPLTRNRKTTDFFDSSNSSRGKKTDLVWVQAKSLLENPNQPGVRLIALKSEAHLRKATNSYNNNNSYNYYTCCSYLIVPDMYLRFRVYKECTGFDTYVFFILQIYRLKKLDAGIFFPYVGRAKYLNAIFLVRPVRQLRDTVVKFFLSIIVFHFRIHWFIKSYNVSRYVAIY